MPIYPSHLLLSHSPVKDLGKVCSTCTYRFWHLDKTLCTNPRRHTRRLKKSFCDILHDMKKEQCFKLLSFWTRHWKITSFIYTYLTFIVKVVWRVKLQRDLRFHLCSPSLKRSRWFKHCEYWVDIVLLERTGCRGCVISEQQDPLWQCHFNNWAGTVGALIHIQNGHKYAREYTHTIAVCQPFRPELCLHIHTYSLSYTHSHTPVT